MGELLAMPGVNVVKGHMCAQGMLAKDERGVAPVLKPTGWASNSPHILYEMNAQCTNDHRHVHLQGGNRSVNSSIYPEQLCYSILRGLRAQMCEQALCRMA